MWRNISSNAMTALIVVMLALAAVILWGRAQYRGAGPLEQAICLKVDRGERIYAVAQELGEVGGVSSPAIFRIGAEYAGRSDDLKAGSFLIEPGASMRAIVTTITEGGQSTCGREVNFRIGVRSSEMLLRELEPSSQDYEEVVAFDPAAEEVPEAYSEAAEAPDMRYRVTVAEGVTSARVAEALGRAEFLSGELEETPEEGRLAPGSYEVTRDTTLAELVADMKARQERVLTDLWTARADGLPLENPAEALTLASIIEKETAVPEERPQVASVFVNRLQEGMRLQTDPTVVYGITDGERVLDRGLRQSELETATPYNTYVIEGLPPTPIANPGKAAIEAALNPAETDYLFFVADGSGGHAFSETLAEHEKNVARWREAQDEQAATQ